MPRPFNEAEKLQIRQRLLQAGHQLFSQYGLRKTSVSDLAEKVGIAKGSYYLFFDSKEALFAEVLGEVEQRLRTEMTQELADRDGHPEAQFRRLLEYPLNVLKTQPLLRVLADPEEMQHLLRGLPPDVFLKNQEDDDAFYGAIFRRWQTEGWLEGHDPMLLSGLLRVMFTLALNRDLVGNQRFDAICSLLVTGLAKAFVKSPKVPLPANMEGDLGHGP